LNPLVRVRFLPGKDPNTFVANLETSTPDVARLFSSVTCSLKCGNKLIFFQLCSTLDNAGRRVESGMTLQVTGSNLLVDLLREGLVVRIHPNCSQDQNDGKKTGGEF
jgi:hypothetical protein